MEKKIKFKFLGLGLASLLFCLATASALTYYFLADTIIEEPEHPQPGFGPRTGLPDSQYINVATEVINLISTYQPAIARKQFETATKNIWGSDGDEFVKSLLGTELSAIEETKRSQVFSINSQLVEVERIPELDTIVVKVPGERQQLIGDKPLPPEKMVYYVKMTNIPRNVLNEYGIVITDIQLKPEEEKVVPQE
jgi:hypothetical protein